MDAHTRLEDSHRWMDTHASKAIAVELGGKRYTRPDDMRRAARAMAQQLKDEAAQRSEGELEDALEVPSWVGPLVVMAAALGGGYLIGRWWSAQKKAATKPQAVPATASFPGLHVVTGDYKTVPAWATT